MAWFLYLSAGPQKLRAYPGLAWSNHGIVMLPMIVDIAGGRFERSAARVEQLAVVRAKRTTQRPGTLSVN